MSGPPGKINPFKPVQPVIPGVPQKPAAEAQPEENSAEHAGGPPPAPQPGPKWQTPPVLAAAGAGIFLLLGGAVLAWRATRPAPPPAPVVIETPADSQEPGSGSSQSAFRAVPEAPGKVATVAEMAKPWSVVKFRMQRPSREMSKAMVIRLPSAPGYWGLLSVAPYGQCELELESDVRKIREEYAFAAIHPMVVDSCTKTVYDPLVLGSSSGVWIRGKIAAGPGIRPPYEVEIKVQGGEVIASRSE